MTNKLTQLNDLLFGQLTKLSRSDLKAEEIAVEAERAEAMVSLADQILRNADLHLKACVVFANHGDRFRKDMPMLTAPAE